MCADLYDHTQRKPAFDQAPALPGSSPDIPVNCAGIRIAREAGDFPYEQYRKIRIH